MKAAIADLSTYKRGRIDLEATKNEMLRQIEEERKQEDEIFHGGIGSHYYEAPKTTAMILRKLAVL